MRDYLAGLAHPADTSDDPITAAMLAAIEPDVTPTPAEGTA